MTAYYPVDIRTANKEDVQSVFSFICALEEKTFDYSRFSELYEMNLNNADNIYLVAVADGKVVGFISCQGQILLHHLGKVYEIQELYVDDEYRNRRVGHMLIQFLENVLSNRKYDSLEVTPSIRRKDAHRFYVACGFSQTHLKFTKPGLLNRD
jgi:PhnO protein